MDSGSCDFRMLNKITNIINENKLKLFGHLVHKGNNFNINYLYTNDFNNTFDDFQSNRGAE